MNKDKIRKFGLIISWAMYDLANQFFALNVVSLYFVRWLTLEKQRPEILYGLAFGISTFFVAISGVVLGAVSDITLRRRPMLVFLTLIAVVFTTLLGIGDVFWGLIFFAIANFGCQTAIVFYNALMINIAPKGKIGLISGIGKMFGYSGAIIALYLIKPVVLKSGYQATFLPTGVLFLIFALPCMLFIKDRAPRKDLGLTYFLKADKIKEIFAALRATALDAHKFPGLLDFLKSAFFGLCAVNAIILFMSVYATRIFGLDEAGVINLITFSTLFAIIGSISSGILSDYLGYKSCFIGVFVLWIIAFLSAAFCQDPHLYWVIGALTGTALGGTWVVSRALAVKLVPPDKIGRVFGLFNLIGYLAAITGALFWGSMLLLLAPLGEFKYRITLLSLTLFMVFGLIFILRLPNQKRIQ